MPNYNKPHEFYAGVELHARSMFVHVVSAKGKTVFERDLPAEPDAYRRNQILCPSNNTEHARQSPWQTGTRNVTLTPLLPLTTR